MLTYSELGKMAELEAVLVFREGFKEGGVSSPPRRPSRSEVARKPLRRLRRQFARVTTRIERTPEYRQSLQRVLELSQELEAALDSAQRERWLALEEALLDHGVRLHRAYFHAGVEQGRRSVRGTPGALEQELLLALARGITRLSRC